MTIFIHCSHHCSEDMEDSTLVVLSVGSINTDCDSALCGKFIFIFFRAAHASPHLDGRIQSHKVWGTTQQRKKQQW